MVRVLPGLPTELGGHCSTRCSRCSSPTPATPSSCWTARWPWSTTTSRCARGRTPAAGPGRGRAADHGTVVHPDGRVPVLGETIVRNLQMGMLRGAAFGGVMDVGYLPDMFGHIAQMPQILPLAGFAHAVVWRGVPSEVTKDAFFWEAPDGSTVRAEYLPVGYGNGASLPDDAKALVRRTADHVEEMERFLIDDLLLHERLGPPRPQPWLDGSWPKPTTCRTTSCSRSPRSPIPRRRPDRGPRASGRASCVRVPGQHVDGRHLQPGRRQAGGRHGRARALERRAEPLAALFQPPAAWPARLLELAWQRDGPQLRARLDLRLLRRRCRRRRAAPLRRGRGPSPPGLADRALKALARSLAEPGTCAQPFARAPVGRGRARGGGRRAAERECRCSPSVSAFPGPWCSTPTPCARCWGCCRARRSTTTPGSRTSGSKRTTRAST